MKNGKLSLMSRVSAVAIMAAGSVIAPNAFAQDDDEIVVTARRQAETLIEVPVSVAASGKERSCCFFKCAAVHEAGQMVVARQKLEFGQSFISVFTGLGELEQRVFLRRHGL